MRWSWLQQAMLRIALLSLTLCLTVQASNEATINTPVEFQQTFNSYRTGSVNPCLFGTIATTYGQGPLPTSLKRPGFKNVWAGGYRSLQLYLHWHKHHRNNQTAVVEKATQSVGWGPPPLWPGNYYLFVYDACALAQHGVNYYVPTVAYWVSRMKSEYGVEVPTETLRILTTKYWNLASYTGCQSRDCLYNVSPDCTSLTECGCSNEFVAAWKYLAQYNPSSGTNTTKSCYAALQAFGNENNGQLSPAAVRAALFWCERAGGWNTGDGLSWYSSDGKGHYTNPEFILENKSFEWMTQVAKSQVTHVLLGTISRLRHKQLRGGFTY